MITVYKERANARDEFFTYFDGQRTYVTQAWVDRERNIEGMKIIDLHDRDVKLHCARR